MVKKYPIPFKLFKNISNIPTAPPPRRPPPTNHGCSFTIAVQHFNFRLLDQIVMPWLSAFIWAKISPNG